ncbi:MAG: type 4a pilus biogenesis protein PilO [Holophagales bacterium]|nr:type 4a pilus biogenesis protein PilO [Holophagales bacterium]
MKNQSLMGVLLGLIVFGALWFSLGSKRNKLEELKISNEKLNVEVEKGLHFKSNYENLKNEVDEQKSRIAVLIELFTLESDRTRVSHMIQKLASASGLGQFQDQKNTDRPIKNEYYFNYPSVFKYLGGFHEFGHFLSLVSGYEKIINISDIVMTRNTTKNNNPVSIEFCLSVYVYDPSADNTTNKSSAAAKSVKNGDKP